MSGQIYPWLVHFLGRRGLDTPDAGRWLYAYQLTADEYVDLHRTLEQALLERSPSSCAKSTLRFDAAFTLYAAEWWKREFSGSHWSWAPILDSLGISPDHWSQIERQSCLISGLRYWGHAPRAQGLAFLGAIASHAGLPMRVVAETRGPLAGLLARTMRRAIRLSLTVDDVASVIRSDSLGLPASLNHEATIQLIAQMVDIVLRLRRDYQLAGSGDPIAVLDARYANWREEFPLLIEDLAARQLLEGLVKEASSSPVMDIGRGVTVLRYLEIDGQHNWEVRSAVSLPSQVYRASLQKWIGRVGEDIPRLLTLEVSAGERQIVGVARTPPGTVGETYRVDRNAAQWSGANAIGEHRLYVRSREEAVGVAQMVGGDALEAEAPWVFSQVDGKWELAAVGSVALHDTVLLALVPASAELEGSYEALSGQPFDGRAADRRLVRVQGTATVTIDGSQCYEICAGVTGAEMDQVAWEGRRLWIDSRPELVFLGMPKLALYAADGARHLVPSAELEWDWGSAERHGQVGVARVTWKRSGITRRRWLLAVLDAVAAVEIQPVDTRSGALIFKGFGSVNASAEGFDAMAETADGEALHLNLKVEANPPSQVVVNTWWSDPRMALRISSPFPAKGARVVAADGSELPPGSEVTHRDLFGARLYVLEVNPHRQSSYVVSIALLPEPGKPTPSRSVRPKFMNGVAQYRLLDFKETVDELLGHSGRLDARAEIQVTDAGRPVSHIRIGRSDMSVEQIDGHLRGPSLALLQAVSLREPASPAVMLEATQRAEAGPFEWDIQELSTERGPWLVSSRAETFPSVRPILVLAAGSADTELVDDDERSLLNAVCASDTKKRSREIVSVLEELVADPNDTNWDALAEYINALSTIPLPAFDVWKAFCVVPEIAASGLLRLWPTPAIQHQSRQLCSRLDTELPFLWELLSVETWGRAMSCLIDQLGEQLSPDLARTIARDALREAFSSLPRSLNGLAVVARHRLSGAAPLIAEDMEELRPLLALGNDPIAFLRDTLWSGPGSLYQQLLQRQVDREWPVNFQLLGQVRMYLENCAAEVKELSGLIARIPREMSAHREAVVLLPIALAIAAASSETDQVSGSLDDVRGARILRAFDREWFDRVYELTLLACLALGYGSWHLPKAELND